MLHVGSWNSLHTGLAGLDGPTTARPPASTYFAAFMPMLPSHSASDQHSSRRAVTSIKASLTKGVRIAMLVAVPSASERRLPKFTICPGDG